MMITLITGIRHVPNVELHARQARMITLVDLLLIAFVNHPPFNNPDVVKEYESIFSYPKVSLLVGMVWMLAVALAKA